MMRREVSEDILQFNILPRLPMKCLGRFMCVSKEWHSFLTTTNFAKMQLLLHQNHKYNDDQKLLLISKARPYSKFRTIDCETPKTPALCRPLPFPVGRPWTIVASLHGLVCIRRESFYTDLVLWNPLTTDYKTLSRPTSHDDYLNFSTCEGQFGLYYSTCDDDYRLLRETYHTNPKLYIYSLKSDSWRKLETTNWPTTNSHFLSRGIFLNEKLYFLKQKQNHGEQYPSYVIMMLDTKTKKLREMATPTLRQEQERTECMDFTVQRGSIHLCVAVRDSRANYYHTMELWRMNGSDGDWTKLMVTNLQRERLSWGDKPLHIMRNGDWLMYHGGHVVQRDMNKHTYQYICELKKMKINQRWKYMETLVSPNQYASNSVITPPSPF